MKFIIQGQNKLSGDIEVKGAKNAALKIIPASLLSNQKIKINNLPDIEDIKQSIKLIKSLGGKVKRNKNICEIQFNEIKKNELTPEISNKFRTSVMFVGPLLARLGEVKFPHPGGCVIGAGIRPIDLFLDGFIALK